MRAASDVIAALTMFCLATCTATLGLVPYAPIVSDRVDMLELNRVYDDNGRPQLTQMIFWDWHHADAELHVVAWRLWKDDGVQPTRDWLRNDYQLLWHDGELLREVRARVWRQSWTQFDPEMADRTTFPKAHRRGLTLDTPGVKPAGSRAAWP